MCRATVRSCAFGGCELPLPPLLLCVSCAVLRAVCRSRCWQSGCELQSGSCGGQRQCSALLLLLLLLRCRCVPPVASASLLLSVSAVAGGDIAEPAASRPPCRRSLTSSRSLSLLFPLSSLSSPVLCCLHGWELQAVSVSASRRRCPRLRPSAVSTSASPPRCPLPLLRRLSRLSAASASFEFHRAAPAPGATDRCPLSSAQYTDTTVTLSQAAVCITAATAAAARCCRLPLPSCPSRARWRAVRPLCSSSSPAPSCRPARAPCRTAR